MVEFDAQGQLLIFYGYTYVHTEERGISLLSERRGVHTRTSKRTQLHYERDKIKPVRTKQSKTTMPV